MADNRSHVSKKSKNVGAGDAAPIGGRGAYDGIEGTNGKDGVAVCEAPAPAPPKRFFMSADSVNKDVNEYVEEVINVLNSDGVKKVTVRLEIEAASENGFTPQIVSAVSENCRTLGVRQSRFE